jgi:hypothetical protein
MTGDDPAAMTLQHGRRRCGIRTQKEAAHALRLSLAACHAKLKGASPVDERTALLMSYHEVFLDLFVGHVLRQAEASLKLAEQLSAPLATAAAQRAIEVLTKLAAVGDSAPAAEARTRALRREPTACLPIRPRGDRIGATAGQDQRHQSNRT